MSDIRNYINPQLRGKFTEAWQLAFMPDGVSYTEDKSGKVIATLIKSVRRGAIVRVRRLFCLGPWTGTPRQRRMAIAQRLDQIKERGGVVLEGETQRRSDVRGQSAQMLMGAYDDIATGGRATGTGKMGRPSGDYTPQQMDAMRQIWFSRRYKTREQATAAVHSLGIKISRTGLYGLFGKPDREAANAVEVINHVPEPSKRRPKGKDYAYFIQDGRKVKIGHSTDPQGVVKALRRGNHRELTLLGVCPGGVKRERALHNKFAEYRVNGEWFRLMPALAQYIARFGKKLAKR